jgi:hypothetical protein
VAEAVAFAADVEGGGVVEESVEESDGEDAVGEDVTPLPEALIGGEDDGLLGLIALVDDLEEEGGVGLLEGQVADLVQDEYLGPDQDLEQGVEAILLALCPGTGDEVVEREEVDAVSVFDGLEGEADGQVSFPDAWRTEEQDVLAVVEEAEGRELGDSLAGHLGLGLEVELFECLGPGQPRELEVGLHAALEAGGELDVEEFVEDLDAELLSLLGAFEYGIERAEGRFHLEFLELVADPLIAEGSAHRTAPSAKRS